MNDLIRKESMSLDLGNMDSIMSFGSEVTSNFRTIARKVDGINQETDTEAVVTGLKNIFDKIDYDELNSITRNEVSNRGFNGFINKIMRKKDKVILKYQSIYGMIDKIYDDLSEWKRQLENNQSKYRTMQKDLEINKENIQQTIEFGMEKIKEMDGEDELTQEKRRIMESKIQRLMRASLMCEQSYQWIETKRKADYNVYNQLNSAHDEVMPSVELLISNVISIKETRQMIESLKFLDDSAKRLIEFSTKEVIDAGKQSAEMSNLSKSDFEIITKSIDDLKRGIEEINKIHDQKKKELEVTFVEYEKLESGGKNEI